VEWIYFDLIYRGFYFVAVHSTGLKSLRPALSGKVLVYNERALRVVFT
jgi:hypothetical protein